MKIFKRSVWCLVTVFFVILFIVTMIGGQVAKLNAASISGMLGISTTKRVNVEGDDTDSEYFKSDYVKKDASGNPEYTTDEDGYRHQVYDSGAMRQNSLAVAEQVASEGAVLLWNEDALPLVSGSSVSLFGITSVKWMAKGSGSSDITITQDGTLKTALEEKGIAVNPTIWNSYNGNRSSYGTKTTSPSSVDSRYKEYEVNEMPWSRIDGTGNLGQYNDAAIMFISRIGGEDGDTKFDNGTEECLDGDYLDLSKEEAEVLANLKKMKDGGGLEKIILVLDTATPMQMKNIMSDEYGIDACLWVGYGGNVSYKAVANVLSGSVNPSGHLPDTYVMDTQSAPANENFGDFTFTQIASSIPASTNNERNNKYVVYQEGIYVGYLYYETRYEDSVIGGRNADAEAGVYAGSGAWNYSDEVAFTFGHGESYTTFAYSDYNVTRTGDEFTVSMTITNTGKVPGKEVMQVYIQKPYTGYDELNGIEKAAVELAGYAKTGLLDPGKSQTLSVTLTEEQFKCYDSYGQGTYILEKGDYYIAAGTDAHDALNNILAAKGYDMDDGMDAVGNADLTHKVTIEKDDYKKYSTSRQTGNAIVNRFDNADINLYEGTADQKITYLSRSDWGETYPKPVALKLTNPVFVEDMQYPASVRDDGSAEMPLTGTVTAEGGEVPLVMLRGEDYDNEYWQHLLNQMTYDEMTKLITMGYLYLAYGGIDSVVAPEVQAKDGTVGLKINNPELGTPMAFPCEELMAATFDDALVEDLGEAFGEEMLHAGYAMVYAPGANIHRSAYGGRNWDYYSEDGFLTGKMYAAQAKGMRAKGAILCTKHFVLNDQERNRHGLVTFANEQSMREIYLKAFELGMEGGTNGLMSSMNRIGAKWTGVHSGLLTGVLREEWGFNGIVETDYALSTGFMTTANAIARGVVAGNDVWMMNGASVERYRENAVVVSAMRESCHRILYTILNSSAMNGFSSNTQIITITPAWERAIDYARIGVGVVAALCLGMTVTSFVLHARHNKDKKRQNAV